MGKFCTPEKPARTISGKNSFIIRNGSVPHTPARTGVLRDDRNHLAGHVEHDGVGVAVGHHAGERAAAGHAEPARVVNHQQIDAARFRHLALMPVPAPPPMIGWPAATLARRRARISSRRNMRSLICPVE